MCILIIMYVCTHAVHGHTQSHTCMRNCTYMCRHFMHRGWIDRHIYAHIHAHTHSDTHMYVHCIYMQACPPMPPPHTHTHTPSYIYLPTFFSNLNRQILLSRWERQARWPCDHFPSQQEPGGLFWPGAHHLSALPDPDPKVSLHLSKMPGSYWGV